MVDSHPSRLVVANGHVAEEDGANSTVPRELDLPHCYLCEIDVVGGDGCKILVVSGLDLLTRKVDNGTTSHCGVLSGGVHVTPAYHRLSAVEFVAGEHRAAGSPLVHHAVGLGNAQVEPLLEGYVAVGDCAGFNVCWEAGGGRVLGVGDTIAGIIALGIHHQVPHLLLTIGGGGSGVPGIGDDRGVVGTDR